MTMKIYRFGGGLDHWTWVNWTNAESERLDRLGHVRGAAIAALEDDAQFGRDRLAAAWKPRTIFPLVIEGEAPLSRRLGDFPNHTSSTVLIFSRRAVDALRDLLGPDDEVLPLESELGEFYVVNVLTVLDCVDIDKCEVWRFPSSGRIGEIRRFEFFPERVTASIFQVIPFIGTGKYFARDDFVQRLQDAGLEGYYTKQVWPHVPRPTPKPRANTRAKT